jgi:coenzyme F420-reducing hydrogenase beta subunit
MGNSCVIIRNEKMEKIYNEMISFGYLEQVKILDATAVVATQLHVLKAKKGNLHKKICYKIFVKYIDYVFKHKSYLNFSYKKYERLCSTYRKICNKSRLTK